MTLKRYIGPCTDEALSSLIQQRLTQEAKRHCPQSLHASLIMDEMKVQERQYYQRQGDRVHGLVNLDGLEDKYKVKGQLASHMLCFVLVGLSTQYR